MIRFRKASRREGGFQRLPPISAPSPFFLRSNRALKIGRGGIILRHATYGSSREVATSFLVPQIRKCEAESKHHIATTTGGRAHHVCRLRRSNSSCARRVVPSTLRPRVPERDVVNQLACLLYVCLFVVSWQWFPAFPRPFSSANGLTAKVCKSRVTPPPFVFRALLLLPARGRGFDRKRRSSHGGEKRGRGHDHHGQGKV